MKGVLLINLGSPNSPTTKDVKTYLDEFLMDEYVIDLPWLVRCILVKGIILNTRPKQSAKAYKKVWTSEGSPLITYTKKLRKKIAQNNSIPLAIGMRYGSPSIEKGIQELINQGVTQILAIPLYPQFAMSSTQTVIEKTNAICNATFPDICVDFLPAFYHKLDYISALSESIKHQLTNIDYDKILFSYHGIPERHIYKSDTTKSHCKIDNRCCKTPSTAHKHCYRHQCFATTKSVIQYLNLPEEKVETAFQSRLGKNPWLQPYTAQRLKQLPSEGIKKLAVVTPAFVSDCLETIEEIGMEGKSDFLSHGGQVFTKIDCLNDDSLWAQTLSNWINNWASD